MVTADVRLFFVQNSKGLSPINRKKVIKNRKNNLRIGGSLDQGEKTH